MNSVFENDTEYIVLKLPAGVMVYLPIATYRRLLARAKETLRVTRG